MPRICSERYQSVFFTCRRILGKESWDRVLAALGNDITPQTFADALASQKTAHHLPDYIDDLARLEWISHQVKSEDAHSTESPEKISINPSLSLVPVSWKHIAALLKNPVSGPDCPQPEASPVHVIIWRHPRTNEFHIREALDIDLLALKIAVEEMDPREAAAIGQTTVGAILAVLRRAVAQGLLLSPPSRIRRAVSLPPQSLKILEPFESADIFTLQWHITQDCDLHCKHCYDRSDREPMAYDTALSILDDFNGFCTRMNVRGQVTFTGGNPLLYPHFLQLYHDTSDRGLGVAILGNPTAEAQMERLCRTTKPLFFQISLEGLEEHNDYIRGAGHFRRSLVFLDQLRKMGIYSMVMLTLTRDNLNQVLPLGELLRERADFFTFNRLSAIGEGKHLLMPEKEKFVSFLYEYETAAAHNPILGFKDNLFNIIRKEKNNAFFGGCTGYGCGAAFNFVSLLPDGEVHACRKFPSPIGDIRHKSLFDIYHSELAQKYRNGSEACRNCHLNPVCRGCLAIIHSHGLDVFKDKDPFCFVSAETGKRTDSHPG
ncbi:MAG: thio(seleno)oxazole modification radical SAM maturase SbtM [Thermodesulfobacteriota bacterium]